LDSREWSASYARYAQSGHAKATYGGSGTWGRNAAHFNQESVLESVFASQGNSGIVRFAKETEKLQIVFVEIECKLYDAKTGELKESGNYSLITNRFYSTVAGTQNLRGTGDLYLDIAKGIANPTASWTMSVLDPIVILKRDDKIVTINRGLGARLKIGGIYSVFAPGEELFDPATHKSLGREEITMGKIAITELHDRFSKATVLEGDKGIATGNYLRMSAN
jgi:hypothetical protein